MIYVKLDTDLHQAQAILYRRLSANLYETKNAGEYFHIHGSLDASTTLKMIGLEPYRPDLTDYRECINTIENHVKQFTAQELEEMNAREKQAGVTVLKWEEFKETNHVSPLYHLTSSQPINSEAGESTSSTPTMDSQESRIQFTSGSLPRP